MAQEELNLDGEGKDGLGQSVTLDDFDELMGGDGGDKTPAPVIIKLSDAKVDGPNAPEHLKGKSGEELLGYVTALERNLALSEEARKTGKPAAAPVVESAPHKEPELTVEEIKKLMEEDPLQAMAYISAQSEKRLAKQFESRMEPITGSARIMAEQGARTRYAKEFELFGDEIKSVADQVPNKAILANPEAWDDIVRYVRGKNYDILIKKDREEFQASQLAATRSAARSAAPVNLTGHAASTSAGSTQDDLDPVEKEILANFQRAGMKIDAKEYRAWGGRK